MINLRSRAIPRSLTRETLSPFGISPNCLRLRFAILASSDRRLRRHRRRTALCFPLTFSGLQLYYDVFKCTPILASFADDAAAHSGFIWLKPAPNKLS